MRIQIAGLPPGPQVFEHRGRASSYLDDQEMFPGEIRIQATLERLADTLCVALEIELPGHFICDRCAAAFERTIRSRETFFFSFTDGGGGSEDEEAGVIPPGMLVLDISQEIRDTVILGLPAKVLCREDCRGLCPVCGADLNQETCTCQREVMDPRWDALKKLKYQK